MGVTWGLSNSKKSKFSVVIGAGLLVKVIWGSWGKTTGFSVCIWLIISVGGLKGSEILVEILDSWKIDSENSILEILFKFEGSWRQWRPYFLTFSSKWLMNFSRSGSINWASSRAFEVLERNRSIIFSSALGKARIRLKIFEEFK